MHGYDVHDVFFLNCGIHGPWVKTKCRAQWQQSEKCIDLIFFSLLFVCVCVGGGDDTYGFEHLYLGQLFCDIHKYLTSYWKLHAILSISNGELNMFYFKKSTLISCACYTCWSIMHQLVWFHVDLFLVVTRLLLE